MTFPSVTPLLTSLGFTPHHLALYEQALTHKSVNGALNTSHIDYERLEFLGDSLMGLVSAELCYLYHPEMEEGDLSKLRSQFIQSESEAAFCQALGIDKYIRTGPSFGVTPEENTHLLEDVFEAFLGALYLDQGREPAYQFLRAFLAPKIAEATVEELHNPIGELNECFQAETTKPITYQEISEEGPSNDRYFVFSACFDGKELGRGGGKSKELAKSAAASSALEKMALHNEDIASLSLKQLHALLSMAPLDY